VIAPIGTTLLDLSFEVLFCCFTTSDHKHELVA